jgi:hypothetical protein
MLKQQGQEFVVFTDRKNRKHLVAVEGTMAFHEVSGPKQENSLPLQDIQPQSEQQPQKWKINVSEMMCSCLACRGDGPDGATCPYLSQRNPSTKYVMIKPEMTEDEKAQKEADKKKEDALLPELQAIFGRPGVSYSKLTARVLKDKLVEKGLSKKGKKFELAERLVIYFREQRNTSNNVV